MANLNYLAGTIQTSQDALRSKSAIRIRILSAIRNR